MDEEADWWFTGQWMLLGHDSIGKKEQCGHTDVIRDLLEGKRLIDDVFLSLYFKTIVLSRNMLETE